MIPTWAEALSAQWGQPRLANDTAPNSAGRSWVWLPKPGSGHQTANHGVRLFSLVAPGQSVHLVKVWSHGTCCPIVGADYTFRTEPTEYQVAALVGMAFGLNDEVIHHHLTQITTRAMEHVRDEIAREGRWQTEQARRYRDADHPQVGLHAYAAQRLEEVERAVAQMVARSRRPAQRHEAMDPTVLQAAKSAAPLRLVDLEPNGD